ncbi:MAG: exodeoxyribonuclease VII large subunit [Prevotella sp.]|nr:exodeoxyribonuclease VII large subunit [Prevotella sp.]
MNDNRYTLLELNGLVRELIETGLPSEYWVEAELSECRESRGHCYMELIQRDERSATPAAKASAKCWASKWAMVRPYFERTTGQQLRSGLKVLMKVYPQFHEAYGFSWIVTDIDPNYTLGDQARRRQEIIRQLKEEGVFDLQKELHLPLFCLNIAVISSQTAAGYGDFAAQLADSPFPFRSQLFPAIMQGEGVEQSIISALNRIYSHKGSDPLCEFDCVVIIRGGGATSDMAGFDTLLLAENVANFPLPIITGIGHDRDECILDMVSHQRVKTPTAAAALLISRLEAVVDTLNDAQNRIINYCGSKLSTLNTQLSTLQASIPRILTVVLTRQRARIEAFEERIPLLTQRRLTQERHQLEIIEEKARMLDPALLLRRGYSITFHNGKAVKTAQALKAGDEIETRLSVGTIKSIIK